MLVLTCNNIEKSFGIETIFKDINFNVKDGDKIGIVGHNGSGKTTLFNIINKDIQQDKGDIYIRRGLKVGYLKQHTQIFSNNTIYEECLSVFEHLKKMEEDLRILEQEIAYEGSKEYSHNLEELMDNYSQLSEKFSESNGYGYESSIRGVLTGLGFEEEDFIKEVNILSGGQKSRLSLAKLLLENPDILLLDEPTNHLDIEAIDWLAQFIKDYKGATLLISHDRYFLDHVVNKIFHMENLSLKEYNTNYTDFIKRRKENIEIQKRHFEDQQAEIKRHKKVIEQYKAYGGERYNRLAKSRQKMLDKIETIEDVKEEHSVRFKFKPKIESGTDVLEVSDLSVNFNSNNIFSNINFNIYKGERIGLIGPNGVGKSTLFKVILNEITNFDGKVNIGHHVNLGYFDQEMSDLNLDKTIIDEIWDDNPTLTHTEIRTVLSQFMFIGDDVFKEISDLSGGEKGRLSILKLIMSESNFLLMDEPTNHLDIDSKEVLEDALLDYEGTVFVISHDRYFLNRVVDKIFVMSNNGIKEYLGNYDYYIEKLNKEKEKKSNKNSGKTKTQIQLDKKKQRNEMLSQRKHNRKIKELEKNIEKYELELENIDLLLSDNEIYDDPEKVLKINEDRENISNKLNNLYDEWIIMTDEN